MTAPGKAAPAALDPALEDVLDAVSLTADGAGVRLGDDREVRADSPRQLRQRLGTALYETFHAGHAFGDRPGILHRDPALETRLSRAMPHTTTPVAARTPGEADDDGPAEHEPVVLLGGVRVRLPAGTPTVQAGSRGRESLHLSLPAARPRLSPGFFLVDGSRGSCGPGPLLRLYVHLAEAEPAVEVWRAVLGRLEEAGVAYRAKVTSSRRLLPRRDALVVYLDSGAWHTVPDIVRAVPPAAVGSAVSAFAHALAPGVALAWEPTDTRPGRRDGSFGQHRSLAVAEGIVDCAENGSLAELHTCVRTALRESGIDPSALFRNVGSPTLSFAS